MHTTAPARAGDHAASGGVHPATVVATALALAVFGWHAWATLRGYFWQDDFRYISRAATEPLGSFLFHDYGGHLMPGQFLLVRLLTAAAPMQYSVAVLPLLALQAVGYVLLWRLLVRLFGHRWSIVVPFAVVVCAPMTFAATLWWAYALQLVPLQVALLGALLAHVGYLQTGHRGRAVLALACTAAGLACWEKALLIAPVLFGVTVAMQPEGSLLARGVVTLRRHRRLWTGYAVLEVGYLAVYLSVTRDAHQAPLPPAELGRLAERMIADTFLPGVLGGPWQVGFDGPVVLAVPPGWALGVAWAVWAAVVVLSLRAGGRRAVLAWLLLAGYLECCLLLVAVARLPLLGAVIGGDPRYVADAVPVAALCGALAFLRPRTAAPQTAAAAPQTAAPQTAAPQTAAPQTAAPQTAAPQTAAPETVPEPTGAPAPPTGHRRRALRVAATALVVVFVAGAGVSAARMAAPGAHTAARQYIEHARAAFDADPDLVLVDAEVPDEVMIWLFLAHRRASQVFAALPAPPAFDRPTEDLRMLDRTGVPRPVMLLDPVAAAPGPAVRCGYALHEEPVAVPLTAVTPPGRRVVRLGYYTATSATGTLEAGDARWSVRFAAGVHYLYAVADGPLYQLRLDGDPGTAVCVTEVLVGAPVPAD